MRTEQLADISDREQAVARVLFLNERFHQKIYPLF